MKMKGSGGGEGRGAISRVRFKLAPMMLLIAAVSISRIHKGASDEAKKFILRINNDLGKKYYSNNIEVPNCARLGKGTDPPYDDYDRLTNVYTIGAEKFRARQGHWISTESDRKYYEYFEWRDGKNLNKSCPFNVTFSQRIPYEQTGFEQDVCTDFVDLRVYAVEQDGRILRGWLHVEIELTDKSLDFILTEDKNIYGNYDWMEYVYVEVRDENFNTIGEFVLDEKEQCKPKAAKDYLVSPSKFQALPCSATGVKEYQNSKALFLAREDNYVNLPAAKPYIHKGNLTRGIYFTWRMSEYDCNRHERFRIDAVVLTSNSRRHADQVEEGQGKTVTTINDDGSVKITGFEYRLQRKMTQFWIHPLWFGAADIKAEGGGALSCTKEAIDLTSGEVKPPADQWIDNSKKLKFTMLTDYMNPLTWGEYTHPDNGDPKKLRMGRSCQLLPWTNTATYGGRCVDDALSKKASKTQLHNCSGSKSDASLGGLNVTYTSYRDILTNRRLSVCNRTCPLPGKNDLDAIKNQSTTKQEHKSLLTFEYLKSLRNSQKRNYIWTCRKIHAQTCLFIVLLFLPISNFLSRYYKETFMSVRWYGCAPWFWIHVGCCFSIIVIFASGRRSLYTYYGNWGHDTEDVATTHRFLGNLALIAFLVLCGLGFNRPTHPLFRVIFAAFHAISGLLIYVLSIVLVITSKDIPMSPSSVGCDFVDEAPPKSDLSLTVLVTIGWACFDLLAHTAMTVVQVLMDRHYNAKRLGFGLPFLTFLPLDYNRDFRGAAIRKIILLVYIVLSFTSFVVAFADMEMRDYDNFQNCSLGTLSCDLTKRENLFGCLYAAQEYLKIVLKKHENSTIVD